MPAGINGGMASHTATQGATMATYDRAAHLTREDLLCLEEQGNPHARLLLNARTNLQQLRAKLEWELRSAADNLRRAADKMRYIEEERRPAESAHGPNSLGILQA